jgi:predicted dehydrogenase
LNDSNILSVLIIGCGNIAGDLDSNKLDLDQAPLTHAGAYTANQHFFVKACVDISQEKSERFARRWGIPNAYTSVDQAIQAGIDYDVISICSPTGCHYEDLITCLSLSPKLVFCEKPVTGTVKDTLKIKAAYGQAGVLLAVNYLRRWDERIISLKKEIETNERGALRSIVGYYNKGISNNGSHLLDLLGFLVGDMVIKHVGHADYDFFQDDPSVCVTLEAEPLVPVLLVPGAKASDYSIFEIQLVFDNCMLLMLDGGLRWVERFAGESEVFDGYRVLDSGMEYQGGYLAAMSHAVDNIWRALIKGDLLNSTIDTALVAHTLCEQISVAAKR